MREISATHGCKGCLEFLSKKGTQTVSSPAMQEVFVNQRSRSDPNLTSFVDKWSEPVEKSVIEDHEEDDKKA